MANGESPSPESNCQSMHSRLPEVPLTGHSTLCYITQHQRTWNFAVFLKHVGLCVLPTKSRLVDGIRWIACNTAVKNDMSGKTIYYHTPCAAPESLVFQPENGLNRP